VNGAIGVETGAAVVGSAVVSIADGVVVGVADGTVDGVADSVVVSVADDVVVGNAVGNPVGTVSISVHFSARGGSNDVVGSAQNDDLHKNVARRLTMTVKMFLRPVLMV
jgi:hypothetical protein